LYANSPKKVSCINLGPKVRTGDEITQKNIREHRRLILFEPVGPFRPR